MSNKTKLYAEHLSFDGDYYRIKGTEDIQVRKHIPNMRGVYTYGTKRLPFLGDTITCIKIAIQDTKFLPAGWIIVDRKQHYAYVIPPTEKVYK